MPRRVPALVSDPAVRLVALARGRAAALTDSGRHERVSGSNAPPPPVVLALHGAPGSHRDFRYLGAYLEPHARVLRVDLPGHGRTPRGDGGLGPAATAAWVAEVLDALGVARPVHVVGHSLAGLVAAQLAAHHSDRCVCVCGGGRPRARLRPTALPLRRVASVSLVCSLGFRPHKGVRPIALVRGVAHAMAHPLGRPLLLPLVHKARRCQRGRRRAAHSLAAHTPRQVYTSYLGFPRSTTREEVVVCQGRVREVDFEAHRRNVEAIPRSMPALLGA